MTSPEFVHLDVRSYFSLKEGAFSPEDLAQRAARLGMPAVALTDRDGLYGAARFVAACEAVGLRPILGAAMTLDGPEGPGGLRFAGQSPPNPRSAKPPGPHIVLLAQDERGYANLCRLITDAHMGGERGDPLLTPEQICAHSAALFAILGPSSLPGELAVAGRPGGAQRAIAPFREAFGNRCYVAVQHRMERDSSAEIRALVQLAEKAGVGVTAANPVRYLVPEDAFLADALECM